MDGFGDDFVSSGDVDPAAEFLAREQDQLAGLEDELDPISSPPATQNSADVENDMFAQDSIEQNDSFVVIDQNDDLFNNELNGDASNKKEDYVDESVEFTESQSYSMPSVPKVVKEEPEKIKIWREEQKKRLEEKDAAEEVNKGELKQKAQAELEEWYKHHAETIAKTKAANRNAEKQFVAEEDEVEPGTEWDRIAKLCEFNPKSSKGSKDVSRMRSMILQLKQNPVQQSTVKS